MRNLTAFALSIGAINPKIGNTKYGWNIFENGSSIFHCGHRVLIATKGTFEVGDTVIIRDNDSQRKLQTLTVKKECATQADLIKAIEEDGFNMKTPRPFQKFVGRKYEPTESYSIKGYDFTEVIEKQLKSK